MSMSRPSLAGLRLVAVFEAAKGVVVLLAGFGLLSLVHRDAQHFAEQLVTHLHLNPANGYPRIFIDAAGNVTNGRLWMLAGFALIYAAVRLVEAYGLWFKRRWAEWFAVASGAIYVPAEVYELFRGVTWMKLVLFGLNVCIVAYMAHVLRDAKRNRPQAP